MKTKRKSSHDQLYNSLQLAYLKDGIVHGISVFSDHDLAIVVNYSRRKQTAEG